MAQSREELVDAAQSWSPSWENRLTEIFATVLDLHQPIAATLFARLGLDAGVRVRVYTQELLVAGAQPDMVADAFDAEDDSGRIVASLWFEHKVHAGFRDLQLEDYRDALHGRPSTGLLAITKAASGLPPTDPDWQVITWQDIAEDCDRLGRNWKGSKWRHEALEPEAPAMWRFLHELVGYLETEDLAMVEGLRREAITAFAKIADTLSGLEAVMAMARDRVNLPARKKTLDWTYESDRCWYLLDLASDHWANHRLRAIGLDGFGELTAVATDGPKGEPRFWAGVTLPDGLYRDLAARAEWRKQIANHDLVLTQFGERTRVMRFLSMETLVGDDEPLSNQAEQLDAFTNAAIGDTAGLDPGELRPIPKKGSKDALSTPEADGPTGE